MKKRRKATPRLATGILVFGMVLWFRPAVSDEIVPVACLPESRFQIAGVGMGDTISGVLRRFGKPIETYELERVDDGGAFNVKRYIFKELEVDIGRDVIIRIASTTIGHAFADGVRIGMDMGEVAKRLRFKPWYGEEASVALGSCGTNLSLLAELHFKETDPSLPEYAFLLVRIEITEYGP